MGWVGLLTGYLWRFQWFQLLSLRIAYYGPPSLADWWAVNTPLLQCLHRILIDHGDFEGARDAVELARAHPGSWSFP